MNSRSHQPSRFERPRQFAPYLLFPIAGVFQTLGLAPFNIWLLGLISVLMLIWSTEALAPRAIRISPRKGALLGWLFGLGLYGSGASWVYVSIHVYGYASPVLASFLTLLFVAGLALFHTLQFYLYFRLRSLHIISNLLLFTGLWLLSDLFRSHFLTGFPWLFLGDGHLDGPLSGWIPVLGVYGITGLIVASAGTLALLTTGLSRRVCGGAIAVMIGLWLLSWALESKQWTQPQDEPLQVALLQINIPQELKWHPSQRRKTLQLLEQRTRDNWNKDLIVWPETAIPMLYDQVRPFLDRISDAAKGTDTAIISGVPYRRIDENNQKTLHNSIVSFGLGDGINHKQKLVPFGEYVPLQSILRGLIAFFDLPMSDFRKGPPEQPLLTAHTHSLAPFICYEVVYPEFVRKRAKNADILLTISNDSWFGTSIGPLQHLEMARMRAAENGRYMIRATNNGVTAIIDEQGRVTTQTRQFVETVLEGSVQAFTGRTPYSLAGNLPVYLFILLATLATIKNRQSKHPSE